MCASGDWRSTWIPGGCHGWVASCNSTTANVRPKVNRARRRRSSAGSRWPPSRSLCFGPDGIGQTGGSLPSSHRGSPAPTGARCVRRWRCARAGSEDGLVWLAATAPGARKSRRRWRRRLGQLIVGRVLRTQRLAAAPDARLTDIRLERAFHERAVMPTLLNGRPRRATVVRVTTPRRPSRTAGDGACSVCLAFAVTTASGPAHRHGTLDDGLAGLRSSRTTARGGSKAWEPRSRAHWLTGEGRSVA